MTPRGRAIYAYVASVGSIMSVRFPFGCRAYDSVAELYGRYSPAEAAQVMTARRAEYRIYPPSPYEISPYPYVKRGESA